MKNWTLEDIQNYGFKGFLKISDLISVCKQIPDERGVYLIIKEENSRVNFLRVGTGGHFKKRNPNVEMGILKTNWVNKSIVIYIGQAGGIRNEKWSDSTLRERLKKYFKFGQGKPVGHWGGRLIWQIEKSKDPIVCWKELPNKIKDPCNEESELIEKFKEYYKQRPFANLRD